MSLSNEEKTMRKNLTADLAKLTEDPNDPSKISNLKPYFFVSYKSDDWEIVLNKIVRTLIGKYGLRVYFDSNFDKDNASWCDNMRDALRCPKCKGVISFVSTEYFSSYACAMELLYANSKDVYRSHKNKMVEIIPIIVDNDKQYIDEIEEAVSYNVVTIKEWNAYTDILASVDSNGAIDNNLKDCIESLLALKDKVKESDLALAMSASLRVNKDAAQERVYNSEDKTWYNDIVETIKRISSDVFDESLIGQCKEESNNVKIELNDKTSENNIGKEVEEKKDKEIVQEEKSNLSNKECIDDNYFVEHLKDKDLLENEQKVQRLYDEFKSKFSPEKLKELSGLTLLRSIFLNDEGNQTNICSLFEYNKEYISFGSIKGGTALKHVLYYSGKEKSWMTGKPPVTYTKLTEQEAIELGTKIRDNIIKACEIIDKYKDKLKTEEAYEQMYNEIDTQADGIHKVLFVKKYFHMMYKDLFPCMFSSGYIRRVAEIFGYEKYLDDTKYIAKFEMTKNKHGISNYLFALIVYKFFDETIGNSSSESKILNK